MRQRGGGWGGGFLGLDGCFLPRLSSVCLDSLGRHPSLFIFGLLEMCSMASLCSARHSCTSAPVSLLREKLGAAINEHPININPHDMTVWAHLCKEVGSIKLKNKKVGKKEKKKQKLKAIY